MENSGAKYASEHNQAQKKAVTKPMGIVTAVIFKRFS